MTRPRSDISTASLKMANDARRGPSIHVQEAQLHLSRKYTQTRMTHKLGWPCELCTSSSLIQILLLCPFYIALCGSVRALVW